MGIEHGAFCTGCCWALMTLLFVLGVMNLLWIAALTLLVCIEKMLPTRAPISAGTGLLLLGWGVWLLV
jgi:predicted metal-binding membrane protein